MPPVSEQTRGRTTANATNSTRHAEELFSGIRFGGYATGAADDPAWSSKNKKNKKSKKNRKNKGGGRKPATAANNDGPTSNNNRSEIPPTRPNTNTSNYVVVGNDAERREPPPSTDPTAAAAAATNDNTLLNQSSYTDSSPFHQYLTQIENDYGVTSIESVGGPNATYDEGEEEVELSAYPPPQQFSNNDNDQREEIYPNNTSIVHSADGADGSVSDMYAIAVMQYDPAAGQYEDDISTLGDESMIRLSRRALWSATGGSDKNENVQALVDADDYEVDILVAEPKKKKNPSTPKEKKPSPHAPVKSKTTAKAVGAVSIITKKKGKTKEKKTPSPPKQQRQPEIDEHNLETTIRINKSKSRSGHTFLQSIFSSSKDDEEDFDDVDKRDTPMSADVYTTVNEFASSKPDEEEGMNEDDDGDEDEVSFVSDNKWVIIRFMVCLSIFLLAVASVALTFGLLYHKDSTIVGGLFSTSGKTNSNDATAPTISEDDVFPPAFTPPAMTASNAPTQVPAAEAKEPLSPGSPQPPKPLRPLPGGTIPAPAASPPTSIENDFVELEDLEFHLLSVLTNQSSSSVDKILMDAASTQSLAYTWMLKDPSYWSYSNSTILQRWILAVFYYSTNGDDWTTENFPIDHQLGKAPWMNYSDECYWESSNQGQDGNICNSEGKLFALHVRSVGLNGTIPTEIGLLSTLRLFLANGNPGLRGTLPTELGLLSGMEKVQIKFNDMEGTIPTELGSWSSLTVAGLENNRFEGTLPTELGLWTNIRTLGVQGNNLRGPLPSEIGRLESLRKYKSQDVYCTIAC